MRERAKSFAVLLMLATGLSPGTPLTDALLQLQRGGLKLVFSSQVVRPDMTVRATPVAREPRRILGELLEPHGLEAVEGPNGVLIVVNARRRSSPAERYVVSEQITVQPSRISLLVEDPAASIGLGREEIEAMPHVGDDVFRALSRLPGTTSDDLSAQFQLRGARRDETLIILDGQELYEPFHLRDFDNALSIVGSSLVAEVDLITAAFPASYGDRMAGILDMATWAPRERRARIAASILGVEAAAGGTAGGGRMAWMTALRRGSTDLLARLFDAGKPAFWDAFGKLEWQIAPRQTARIHALTSGDGLHVDENGEIKRLKTEYDAAYVWLTHRAIVHSDRFVDTTGSFARLQRARRGHEIDDERSFDVVDERETDVLALVQTWNRQLAANHFLTGGAEVRRFSTSIDYASDSRFVTPLIALRTVPAGPHSSTHEVSRDYLAAHFSDRLQPLDTLTIEAGLRYDRMTQVSPRLNAVWAVAPSTVVRLGWGHFAQTQRPYELMIEDHDAQLYEPESSEQWVAGIEHHFAHSSPLASVRLELYRRTVDDPRPRYENLFASFDPFPEGDVDRIRIEAEAARAQGAELMVHGRPAERVNWWLSYALASTDDTIDGERVPRRVDERHALNLNVSLRAGKVWNIGSAWAYRSGRPVTPLTLSASGEPMTARRNSVRLAASHRLDMRLSRDWQRRTGTLAFFVDAQNVYARGNIAGLDNKVVDGILTTGRELYPRFLASAGVSWEWR
jgi:outer membrane receptor protein involved in Fe transport